MSVVRRSCSSVSLDSEYSQRYDGRAEDMEVCRSEEGVESRHWRSPCLWAVLSLWTEHFLLWL